MQRLPVQPVGGKCLWPFCALMQMPDIHVLRVAGQCLAGVVDGGALGIVQVRCHHPAGQQELIGGAIMNVCVIAHGGTGCGALA